MICYPVLTEHCNEPTSAVFIEMCKRALVTAYPFCMGERPLRTLAWLAKKLGDRSVVLDSGLFTLLKERHKLGESPREAQPYYDAYFERYKRVLEVIPDHWLIVELDVHTFKADVEGYRSWLTANYPHRGIYVWHVEDGFPKFREYFERFTRIGCSQRELSLHGIDQRVMHRMLNAVRDVRDGRHVHVLGTAADDFLERYGDWSSCDSSSWNTIALFGQTRAGVHRAAYSNANKRVRSSDWITEHVNSIMPRLVNTYREHPDYKRKREVRIPYLRQLASGLLAFMEHVEQKRLENGSGYDDRVVDPLDYWNLRGVKSKTL